MSKKGSVTSLHPMIFLLLLALNPFVGSSQGKRIVVLGSSTAAQNNTWSWANRYRNYLSSLNSSNQLINLASGGFTTWKVMPTGSGVGEDPDRNITKALSLNPDAIIVNLPTNDAYGIPLAQTMANFRLLRQLANAAGVSFWITTSQGRTTTAFPLLVETRDSINAQFGAYAIDFFTTVANPDGSLNAMYDIGDHTHINEAGHDIFYERVKSSSILGQSVLPIVFNSFKIKSNGSICQLSWQVNGSTAPFKQDIQRSEDGVIFRNIGTLAASMNGTFQFTDTKPLTNSNYYRIKISTTNDIKYSDIILFSEQNNVPKLIVTPNPAKSGGIVHLDIKNTGDETGLFLIYNAVGKEVFRKLIKLDRGALFSSYTLSTGVLPGTYFVNFKTKSANLVQQFVAW